MASSPDPPPTYEAFVKRFPELAEAWHQCSRAGSAGPLDDKSCRLIRLALAIGGGREGAVHAGARKALAQGITAEELEQVVSIAAATLGFPAAVAAFSWVRDVTEIR